MPDYNASFECIDMAIDWAENYADPEAIRLATGGDLTETRMFLDTRKGTRHNALDLLGIWMAGNKIADHLVLTQELFEAGSENKFTVMRISRPSKGGESGFVSFEIVLDVTEAWSVDTDRGALPAKRIALILRLQLTPMH